MPNLHLRQPGFTNTAFGLFTKHCEKIKKFVETGDLNFIYEKGLDKTCFDNDTVYDNSKKPDERTVLDKILNDRTYEIALNPNYNGYQTELASMMYHVFDKKIVSRTTSKWGANVDK